MDSLNFYDIKAEKANAISRHNKIGRKITSLFRLIEALIVIVLISRLSFTALKHSGGLLRDASVFFFSPRFVFFLGNLIVVVLFAKSSRASAAKKGNKSSSGYAIDDLYDEFLKRSEKSQTRCHNTVSRAKKNFEKEEIEPCLEIKNFVRSNSEVFLDRSKKSLISTTPATRVLKRSQTEKIGKMAVVNSGNSNNELYEVAKCFDYPEDSMSGEEFRLKVEAFIARQQRFRTMEEEFSGDEIY